MTWFRKPKVVSAEPTPLPCARCGNPEGTTQISIVGTASPAASQKPIWLCAACRDTLLGGAIGN